MYQDPADEKLPFMIVKIDSNYVVCDKLLPFKTEKDLEGVALFSFYKQYPLLAYVEKALAVYLK